MTNPNTALYYPGYHMKLGWIKAALLYWEDVGRIVPSEAAKTVDDHLSDYQMLVDQKALLNFSPDEYLKEAAEKFDNYLVPLFEQDADAIYDAEYLKEKLSSYMQIHPEKLTSVLQNDMAIFGATPSDDGYIKVPSHVGGPYMMCLGSVISDHTGFPLVTDDHAFEAMGEYLSFSAGQKAVVEDPHYKALLRLGITMPSPGAMINLPMKTLLKFREKRQAERIEMRDAVSQLIEKASQLGDPNSIKDFWMGHNKRVVQALKAYRDTMVDLRLIDIGSMLKIGIPAGVASGIAAWSGWISPEVAGILTATAFGISAARWWGKRRFRRRAASQGCPWHYALLTERTFHS